jgi:hypothetical protein
MCCAGRVVCRYWDEMSANVKTRTGNMAILETVTRTKSMHMLGRVACRCYEE